HRRPRHPASDRALTGSSGVAGRVPQGGPAKLRPAVRRQLDSPHRQRHEEAILPEHSRPSPLRRWAVIAGIAGTLGVGAYGLSAAAAAAAQSNTPSTTQPPATAPAPTPNQPGNGNSRGPAGNPNCPNMGGQQNGGASSSSYAPV